jgi:hypothetical protein
VLSYPCEPLRHTKIVYLKHEMHFLTEKDYRTSEDSSRFVMTTRAKLSLLTSTALVYNCTTSSVHDTWEASPSFIPDGALGSEG